MLIHNEGSPIKLIYSGVETSLQIIKLPEAPTVNPLPNTYIMINTKTLLVIIIYLKWRYYESLRDYLERRVLIASRVRCWLVSCGRLVEKIYGGTASPARCSPGETHTELTMPVRISSTIYATIGLVRSRRNLTRRISSIAT